MCHVLRLQCISLTSRVMPQHKSEETLWLLIIVSDVTPLAGRRSILALSQGACMSMHSTPTFATSFLTWTRSPHKVCIRFGACVFCCLHDFHHPSLVCRCCVMPCFRAEGNGHSVGRLLDWTISPWAALRPLVVELGGVGGDGPGGDVDRFSR